MNKTYSAFARLAIKCCRTISSAGSQSELMLADVALEQPNINNSSDVFSCVGSNEPLPAITGTVEDVDGDLPEQRCGQLFSLLLSTYTDLYLEEFQCTLLLCPVRSKKLLYDQVPDNFGKVLWAHSVEEALDLFDDQVLNLKPGSLIQWVSIDSLLDFKKYRLQNGDLATERNPEGRILSEGASSLGFIVQSDECENNVAKYSFEPFSNVAATEVTETIAKMLENTVPSFVISNRSTNDAQQISEWYRVFGAPKQGLNHLSTRQSLGDTGLNEFGVVLALSWALAKYIQSDSSSPCLVFYGYYRLYLPSLVIARQPKKDSYSHIYGMQYE